MAKPRRNQKQKLTPKEAEFVMGQTAQRNKLIVDLAKLLCGTFVTIFLGYQLVEKGKQVLIEWAGKETVAEIFVHFQGGSKFVSSLINFLMVAGPFGVIISLSIVSLVIKKWLSIDVSSELDKIRRQEIESQSTQNKSE